MDTAEEEIVELKRLKNSPKKKTGEGKVIENIKACIKHLVNSKR